MNRRVFVFSGTALAALPLGALVQRVAAQTETSYQTTLTGSVIEFGDSGFTLGETGTQNDVETVELLLDSAAAYIDFVPTIDDHEAFIESSITDILDAGLGAELVDSGVFDDGAWAVMSATIDGTPTALYREVQLGAYPEYDLVLSLRSSNDEFEDVITAFQDVTIDGFAPFLFLEDTDAIALVAAIVPVATTGRSQRTSRTATATETPTGQTSRRSRTSTRTSTTDDGSYREAVRAHRQEFQLTIVDFATSLGVLTDTTSTTAQTDTALLDIDALAEEWITYPEQAAKLTAPSSESVLAGLYETWSDEIAELAEIWQAARVGSSDAESILTQFEVVLDADDALGAELGDAAMRGRSSLARHITRLSLI